MNANLKANLRRPFLKLKWKLRERARIKDAYYSVRSIKEILIKQKLVYKDILKEERSPMKNPQRIHELEGQLQCIDWLFEE